MIFREFKCAVFSGFLLFLPTCSDKAPQNTSRISYGNGAAMDSSSQGARSVVRLARLKDSGEDSPYCSGVLISPRVVLTAGHCVFPLDEQRFHNGPPFEPRSIRARFSNGSETEAVQSESPKNLRFSYSYVDGLDIGLIVLKEAAPQELVADVASENEFKDWSRQLAPQGKGIGFGKTNNGPSGGSLNSLDVPYMGLFGPRKDPKTLEVVRANTPNSEARPLEFMAGYEDKNACPGDSGGGLFISIDGTFKLAGIASRNIEMDTIEEDPCAWGALTTIYASANVAAQWAKAKVPEAFSTHAEN